MECVANYIVERTLYIFSRSHHALDTFLRNLNGAEWKIRAWPYVYTASDGATGQLTRPTQGY